MNYFQKLTKFYAQIHFEKKNGQTQTGSKREYTLIYVTTILFFNYFPLTMQEKALIGSSNGVFGEVKLCKNGHCSSSLTIIRRLSRVAKKSHHWLPSIHEDYYGPRGHRPRHH